METNEIMNNEEVMETTTEEIVKASFVTGQLRTESTDERRNVYISE